MIPDAILSIIALITKVKKPRDRILIGRVNRRAIGLKNAFKIPKHGGRQKCRRKPADMDAVKKIGRKKDGAGQGQPSDNNTIH